MERKGGERRERERRGRKTPNKCGLATGQDYDLVLSRGLGDHPLALTLFSCHRVSYMRSRRFDTGIVVIECFVRSD